MAFDVQGGGSDLVFPHHEMGAAHGAPADRGPAVRAGLRARRHGRARRPQDEQVAGQPGARLAAAGRRGRSRGAIRLAILAHHYRSDWEWTDAGLADAQQRLARWRAATSVAAGPDAEPLLAVVRARLADDLDAPGALAAVDAWAAAAGTGDLVDGAPALVRDLVDALLGVKL